LKTRIILIIVVVILEVLNYFYSLNHLGYFQNVQATFNSDVFYSLTARYSARISFAILIGLSLWIISKSLLTIVANPNKKDWLIGGVAAFSVNHLIHFYFLFKNFEVNGMDVWDKSNSFGALAYVILSIAPLFFWKIRLWTRLRYYLLHGFIALMLVVCVFTYSTRFGRVDPLPMTTPMPVFKVFIGVGVITLLGLLVRVIVDRKNWA